jgi:hypothetical protein
MGTPVSFTNKTTIHVILKKVAYYVNDLSTSQGVICINIYNHICSPVLDFSDRVVLIIVNYRLLITLLDFNDRLVLIIVNYRLLITLLDY